ncbi:MAG: glycosyltransferase family 4 protein [Candidatus Rokubacteria bacterium]|nr:glycosyltransferase family 4 protein [Candidatus Rokubacteria bacterium]
MTSEAGRGRLLIVNLRGFQRADALYPELAALGWKTTVLDMPEPALLRRYALARSFHPSPARWRRRFERAANRLARTAFAFKYKSRLCGRLIAKSGARHDLILQGGGMFAPGWPPPAQRYAVVCDCTVRLGEGETLSGVDFASAASAERWYALERRLYRSAGCVFSASDWVRHSLIGNYGVDPARALTVGEGCNFAVSDRLAKHYDGKTILYVGYEFERKGGEVLLAAFERVAAEIPDAELLIAGPRRLAGPLPRGVRLFGTVSRQELSRLYSRASLFVMPSLFEPFGLVFLEAMEHGLPCIGSDKCAISEIIVDGETGLITPAGDVGALAEKIGYLLRRPETMRVMGERGRERVHERFTWPAVARRIDARLVGLLEVSSPHPGVTWHG